MSLVFTVTYLLRACNLMITTIAHIGFGGDIIESKFGWHMYNLTFFMLWDLPAILSTIYYHRILIKQLQNEEKLVE
jgi:hypothetical protein